MNQALPDDFRLPPLREDLRIEPASPLASGAPAWVIYDPARHRYFQIGQRAVEMLSAWADGTVGAVRERLHRERGWRPDQTDIAGLLGFLFSNELTAAPAKGGSSALADRARKQQRGALLGLAKAYLFFRIPLLRPAGFLEATAPFAAPFFTRAFALFVIAAGVIGLALTLRQFDAFLAYAERFVSLESAFVYAAALIFVKVFHELGHAYQATLRGVRVTSMGVAFMVMLPLLYTDVSDAWRTRNRRDKLMIDAGGVLVELCLAALATLLWVFLPDGPVRVAAFAVATTSWVLSLLVNLNPFMRFDGYYFLSDATGVQNLQPRGFAMTRWWLRECLFGLGDPPPENVPASTRMFMIWYSWGTWIYRLFLFIGIALIVYHLFFKVLGVLLFVIEIVFFIALPVMKEMGVWMSMMPRMLRSRRAWFTGAVLVGLAAFVAVPLPVTIRAPAVLTVATDVEVFPAASGKVVEVRMEPGRRVGAGDVLARMVSPEIDSAAKRTAMRIDLLQVRINRGAADAEERAVIQTLQRELESERERASGLERLQDALTIRAPASGVLVEVDPGIRPEEWIGRRTRLTRIVDGDAAVVRGYLAEDDLGRLDRGAVGTFVPDDPTAPSARVTIADISGFAAPSLDPGYLASTNGGAIPVENSGGDGPPVPFGSWFAFRGQVPDEETRTIPQIQRGVLLIEGHRESWLRRALVQVVRVFVREAGV